jgi:hypothetical protein
MSMAIMELVWPAPQYLAGYVDALKRGWSPDNRRPQAAIEELARIAHDPALFLSEQIDREAKVHRLSFQTVPRSLVCLDMCDGSGMASSVV